MKGNRRTEGEREAFKDGLAIGMLLGVIVALVLAAAFSWGHA